MVDTQLILQQHFALVRESVFSCNDGNVLHQFLCWPVQEAVFS